MSIVLASLIVGWFGAVEKLAGKFEPLGVAPGLFEIATTPELRERLSQFFQEKGDLLGYAVCSLASQK